VGFSFSGCAERRRWLWQKGDLTEEIEAYSAQFGTLQTANGKTIYAVTSATRAYGVFHFFEDDGGDLQCPPVFSASGNRELQEWREHFIQGGTRLRVMPQDSQLLRRFPNEPRRISSPNCHLLAIAVVSWEPNRRRPTAVVGRRGLQTKCWCGIENAQPGC